VIGGRNIRDIPIRLCSAILLEEFPEVQRDNKIILVSEKVAE